MLRSAIVNSGLASLSCTATVIAEGEGLTYQWYGREANGREFKSGLTGDKYSVKMTPPSPAARSGA